MADPIQEVIEVETGDAEQAFARLQGEVSGLREELEAMRSELGGTASDTDDLGQGATQATGALQGLSRGGVSGLSSAVRVVNPELGSMLMMFGALQVALPKLAASLKALPAALGPIGVAAIAAAAAYTALTSATSSLGEELDELNRQLDLNFAKQERLRRASDSLKEIQQSLQDEYFILTGQLTEAAVAQREFNEQIDAHIQAEIDSGLLTEEKIRIIKMQGEGLKTLFANNQALREAEEAREAAAKAAAEADKQAARDARERAAAEAELEEAMRQARTEADKRREAAAKAAAEADKQAARERAAAEAEREEAMRQALREAEEAREAALERASGIGQTGGDPLALLGLAGPVGGAVSGIMGGLASLGAKSDKDIDAMFGGLAEDIISGIEKIPSLLGPLVIDFALALARELPRAVLEAGARLIAELVALIFPNRADKTPGVRTAEDEENLAEALAFTEEMQTKMEEASQSHAFRTSASDVSAFDASPGLARAFGGTRGRGPGAGGGRMSVTLRQPGIFGTSQQIDLATGPGGLREKP